MSKLKDVVNEIEEEAENIELKAKQLNAKLDEAADAGLQKAQRSQFTGLWMLLAILAILAGVLWFIVH
jgi:vacuolar-type H+-ATPase subunit E/Vma4